MFVLFLRGRCPDFKACAIQVLRLRTANLLQGVTLTVSLYGRLFNESFRLYYLRNIFTAFAVGLSGQNEAKFQKLESFLSLPSIFGYLGKETKNTAEHVIMKKKTFYLRCHRVSPPLLWCLMRALWNCRNCVLNNVSPCGKKFYNKAEIIIKLLSFSRHWSEFPTYVLQR